MKASEGRRRGKAKVDVINCKLCSLSKIRPGTLRTREVDILRLSEEKRVESSFRFEGEIEVRMLLVFLCILGIVCV